MPGAVKGLLATGPGQGKTRNLKRTCFFFKEQGGCRMRSASQKSQRPVHVGQKRGAVMGGGNLKMFIPDQSPGHLPAVCGSGANGQ